MNNSERIQREIEIRVIDNDGRPVSFDYTFNKSGGFSTWSVRKKLFGKEVKVGKDIDEANHIIKQLPEGVIGTLIASEVENDSNLNIKKGKLTIYIDVTGVYAKKLMSKKKNVNEIVSKIKGEHEEAIIQLAKETQKRLYNESIEMRVYDYGVYEDKGDCAGDGLSFEKLEMAKIDSPELRIALTRAIVNTMNTKLSQPGKKYYYTAGVDLWGKECVSMKVKIHQTSNLKSW